MGLKLQDLGLRVKGLGFTGAGAGLGVEVLCDRPDLFAGVSCLMFGVRVHGEGPHVASEGLRIGLFAAVSCWMSGVRVYGQQSHVGSQGLTTDLFAAVLCLLFDVRVYSEGSHTGSKRGGGGPIIYHLFWPQGGRPLDLNPQGPGIQVQGLRCPVSGSKSSAIEPFCLPGGGQGVEVRVWGMG